MLAKIISICNQKGGVGKTTTAVNCGIALAKLGKRVLAVDLDSQANLTMCLGFDPDELETTIVDMLSQVANEASIDDKKQYLLQAEGIDFIPSDIRLSGLENTLVNVIGRERLLQTVLKPYLNDYDYILIDCQPSLNLITINALVASTSVLIPVQSHYLSARGLQMLLATINKVRKQMNPDLYIEGILLTMFDRRTNFAKSINETIRVNYGDDIRVFESIIPASIKAAETSASGKSIFGFDPNGKIAKAYEQLSKEVANNE